MMKIGSDFDLYENLLSRFKPLPSAAHRLKTVAFGRTPAENGGTVRWSAAARM
jgi:hypothetical protein